MNFLNRLNFLNRWKSHKQKKIQRTFLTIRFSIFWLEELENIFFLSFYDNFKRIIQRHKGIRRAWSLSNGHYGSQSALIEWNYQNWIHYRLKTSNPLDAREWRIRDSGTKSSFIIVDMQVGNRGLFPIDVRIFSNVKYICIYGILHFLCLKSKEH